MKSIFFGIFVFFVSAISFAGDCGGNKGTTFVDSLLSQSGTYQVALAEKRGCCSWHGGVCGCNQASGRAICCDNTLSPSCGCD